MNSTIEKYITLLFAAIFSALPPLLVKEYLKEPSRKIFIYLAIISYTVVIAFYVKIFSAENATSNYSSIKYLSIILVVMFGFFYYSDELSTKQLFGIILGMVAIYLIH